MVSIDELHNRGILKILFYAGLAVVILLEFVFMGVHVEFSLEHIAEFPVFHAIFGFISCLLLVFTAKFLGHRWLMKEEDYYD